MGVPRSYQSRVPAGSLPATGSRAPAARPRASAARPGAGPGAAAAAPAAVRGAEAGPGPQPEAKRPAVSGAAGERGSGRPGGMAGTAISSHAELAPKQLLPPAAAGEAAPGTATWGHPATRNCGSLSRVDGPLPHHGPPALRRPLLAREKSFVCVPPLFGAGPGREGAAAGAGGGKGGSYLLFIYLFI